MSVLKRSGCPY